MSDVDENVGMPDMSGDVSEQPVEQPSPWASWEQAGIDPTSMNPEDVRSATQFFEAMRNPDQRGYALSYFASQLSDEDRSTVFGQPPAQQDDDGFEDYGEYDDGEQMLTPDQVQAMIQQSLSEYQQKATEEARQQQVQQEFERELLRATDGYGDHERTWVAASALSIRNQNPYLTTAQVVDQARKQYEDAVQQRFTRVAASQQQSNSGVQLPPGAPPSGNQPPRTPEEAMQQYLRQSR